MAGVLYSFLEKFVPQSRREELRSQFEHLRQNGISVTQYEMRFSKLAHHEVWSIPTDRERISRFIYGLTYQLQLLMTRERVSGATFDEVVDIARQIEVVSSQEGGQFSFSAVPMQSSHHASSTQYSTGNSSGYLEQQFRQRRDYFEFGEFGHYKRDCPKLLSRAPQ
ncbi:uncharacterized protein [Nicotiana tomentosiformis]|uniref:uncharacterized protein n=1 Tax=Nicotiana tomentosiformis TaxID=4098 RepID=UPI00388C76B1